MASLKTQGNDASVETFLDSIDHPVRQADASVVLEMMQEITGEPARMWGSAIVGFGHYTYVYASGRSGEWMRTGFSPRKQYTSVYIMPGFSLAEDLLAGLGKFKHGKSCLNIKKLDDVDLGVLREIVVRSWDFMQEKYGE
jgi:hypothetical protein